MISPICLKVTPLGPGQSYDCSIANEVTLELWVNISPESTASNIITITKNKQTKSQPSAYSMAHDVCGKVNKRVDSPKCVIYMAWKRIPHNFVREIHVLRENHYASVVWKSNRWVASFFDISRVRGRCWCKNAIAAKWCQFRAIHNCIFVLPWMTNKYTFNQ